MRKQIIARALLQPNKNFPIDAETLDGLQGNITAAQALGNIVGDKAILYGCAPESNGTRRAAGLVFLRTRDYPEGEVVMWEGGNVSGGMYLHQENVAVTAQGYDFPQAYTERSLKPGVGSENYSWADFTQPKTPAELLAEINRLNAVIATLAPAPLGIVQMWAGALNAIPAGWALCDGSSLAIKDYPELYKALGMTHGGVSGNSFKLPDLRSRFIVGYNSTDADYNTQGKAGGAKTVAITTANMPSHTHNVNDYYLLENDSFIRPISGSEIVPSREGPAIKKDNDNDALLYKTHATASAGSGTAHENRPPYFTLAYIMKTKN
jgi:microcystin-dependent protein